MKRNRPKPVKPKYVPGATWTDVLKGKPVIRGERRQRKKNRPKPKAFRCRDCSRSEQLLRSATRHRCPACGGIMDPVLVPKP